ncbi:MAG: hypothetical protein ACMUEM_03130 [Flavobacteriales bacterium AspAUS03]
MGLLIYNEVVRNYRVAVEKVLSEDRQLLYGGKILFWKCYLVKPTLIAVRYDFLLV